MAVVFRRLLGAHSFQLCVAYHILYKKAVFSYNQKKKERNMYSNIKSLPVNFVVEILPVNEALSDILGSVNLVIIFWQYM